MKEALRLALEALEKVNARSVIMGSTGDYRDGQLDALSAVSQDVALAITAIKEALAQPEQEPVATIDSLEQEIYENTREFVSLNVMEWLLNRLNTAPPKRPWGKPWVSLTDEEYDEIWRMDLNNKDIMDKTIAKLKEINT